MRMAFPLLLALSPLPAHAAPAGEGYVLSYRVSLHYADEGQGDPIVLIHEMGMNRTRWDAIVPGLARDHRVVRYDLRGFGLPEKLAGPVTMHDEIDDLGAVLARLGVRRPVLVGRAVGGAVALAYAAAHPEDVRGVVALSPAVGVSQAGWVAAMNSAARIERMGMRPLLGNMLDICPAAWRHDNAQEERFRAIQWSSDPAAVAATLLTSATRHVEARLPQVQCPALIVAARLVPTGSVAQARVLASHMPHA
jgi:3-oxoadipate enol-lactonase